MVKQVYKDGTNFTGGVAVSSTNTYYSDAINVDGEAASWHFVWTGTPTGTFTLWYSNKPDASAADDTDWVQDTSFPASNPAGSASKAFVALSGVGALRARIKYVNASGSGTVKAWAYISNGRA